VTAPGGPDAATAADLQPPEVDFSAIGAFCGHDQLLMRRLRASLAVIARRTDDPGLRQACLAALQGSSSVRRVFEHPAFRAMAERSADNLAEGLARLDVETREEVLERVGSRETSEATEFALMEGRSVPPRDER
jgi:hypothetical protein